MIDKTQKKILILAMHAGEIMMKSGAEVYRVEDTITRICKACKIPFVECFATTTGIFISLDNGDEESDMYTFIKRIHSSEIDLQKISAVNSFSREFTTTDLSVDDGFAMLKKIDASKRYPFSARAFGGAMISAFVCLMFSGDVSSGIYASIIGFLAYCFSSLVVKVKINSFLRTFICCAFCSSLSILTFYLGLTSVYAPIIIGTITMFLPGAALTNAARDLLSGDMLAGTARAVDAFITAIAIAGGVGFILKLIELLGGSII